jgi:hypothetical protein
MYFIGYIKYLKFTYGGGGAMMLGFKWWIGIGGGGGGGASKLGFKTWAGSELNRKN